MEMALSKHEINLLVRFAEKNFKNLPMTCIELFKGEPKVPGYGNIMGEDTVLTLNLGLSVSLGKAYEIDTKDEDDLVIELADVFAQEYSMHISELLLEIMTNKEDCVSTTVPKLIRYAAMEKSPIIITSPTTATKFVNEAGFKLASVTSHDIDSNYFYELGKINNITVIVDPLMQNEDYTYLITGNIIEYRMAETDEESFITYELSEDGNDMLAVFKPVVLQYRLDVSDSNYKFFSIKDDKDS